MTDATLMSALDEAMQAEEKARDFYRDALTKVSSGKGKDLLNQLVDFEQNHYDKLMELKKSLASSGTFIAYSGTSFKPYTSGAKSEVSGDIEPNKDELLQILSLAIEAESMAYKRYRDLADSVQDARGKDMFLKLADEETMHRRILSDEYYQMNNRGGLWFWGD